MPKGGPIEVDLSSPAVNQLWDNVRYVMNMTSEKMRPFLKLFGVDDGNGLTPFAAHIDTTDQLLELVKAYFRPPKRDLHGLNGSIELSTAIASEDDAECIRDDDADDQGLNDGRDELAPDIVEAFMKDIAEAEAGSDTSSSNETIASEPSNINTMESFFTNVNSSAFLRNSSQ